MGSVRPSILIAEDDPAMQFLLRSEFEAEDFEVSSCGDGAEALTSARQLKPSLIVLDWNMPAISGLDVCKRLRDTGVTTPVLMITARVDVEDRILALDSGVDDVIVKPFNIRELIARARSLIRRVNDLDDEVLAFNGLSLNLLERRCIFDGQDVRLTVREFDLLKCLLNHSPAVVSREVAISEVWGDEYFGDSNVVDVYIRYLRKKLEDVSPDRLIETVRGVGFVLRERS
jgi:two-component system, OmpR family, response regulator MprA